MQPRRSARQLGGIIDAICLAPPPAARTADSALFFQEEIAACFGGGKPLAEIVSSLEAGSSAWHQQVHLVSTR